MDFEEMEKIITMDCNIDCDMCPFSEEQNRLGISCDRLKGKYPEKNKEITANYIPKCKECQGFYPIFEIIEITATTKYENPHAHICVSEHKVVSKTLCDYCRNNILNQNKEPERKRADETKAFYLDKEDSLVDRKLFVHNLGELLSQTREGIIGCELDDDDIVTIYFIGGTTKVNVKLDSYFAIIKDVIKYI